MKLLLDMNLSPGWVAFLTGRGLDAVHWASVGDPRAPDTALMAWARVHQRVVITRDLDFSTLLALTGSLGPSVVQLRGQDVLPTAIGDALIGALEQQAAALEEGALVTLNERGTRVRILPLRR